MELQDYIEYRWKVLRFVDHLLAAGHTMDDYMITELAFLEQRIKELKDGQKRDATPDKDADGV